jgi:hypothetical protein
MLLSRSLAVVDVVNTLQVAVFWVVTPRRRAFLPPSSGEIPDGGVKDGSLRHRHTASQPRRLRLENAVRRTWKKIDRDGSNVISADS